MRERFITYIFLKTYSNYNNTPTHPHPCVPPQNNKNLFSIENTLITYHILIFNILFEIIWWILFILFFSNGSTSGNGNLDRTPFDEEEWDEEGHIDPLVDNGEPGVKVRALYDYEAAESDELDFKAGNYMLKHSS